MEFNNSPASASVEVMVVQEEPLNQQVGIENNCGGWRAFRMWFGRGANYEWRQIKIPVSSKCKLMLELLEKFVAEVSSDVMTEIQVQPEVCKGPSPRTDYVLEISP